MKTDEHDNSLIGDWPERFVQRKLPEIMLLDQWFEVDVDFGVLRNKDNIAACIPFDRMQIEDGMYTFYFDFGLGKTQVFVPQMVNLDPEGVAKKYGMSVTDLPKNDADLQSNSEWIDSRIRYGRLPIMKIVDQEYYVDIRLGELRKTDNWSGTIKLFDCDRLDDKFYFFYDFKKHEVAHIPDHISEMPRNVVLVELPDVIRMDPVAVGTIVLEDEKHFLEKHAVAMRPRQEARIHPLEKTAIPDRIKANLAKQKYDTALKPRVRKIRGRKP